MNYSEVFKQMKELTDQKIPVSKGNPTAFNNSPKRMDYKGKKK